MLVTSSTLVTKLSINVADNEFGQSDYVQDETRILSAFSAFNELIAADYRIFSTKKGDQSAKKDDQAAKSGGNSAESFEYLTLNTKKAFNLLRHTFIEAFILYHLDPK